MSKAFTPEVGVRPFVAKVAEEKTLINYPEIGAPIIASAGPSRIVGRVEEQETKYANLSRQIRFARYGVGYGSEWLNPSEWSIEILTEDEYAELIAPFEVVTEAEALVSA